MDKIKELTTLEEVQVISVPYRIKILNCMYSFKVPVTVKNIADKMGETPAKIHYHIKKMEQVGIVKLVYTENIKGIMAKFYEPVAEQFHLNHKEGMDKDKLQFLSETQKTIASIFDESKSHFLNQIDAASKNPEGMKHNGLIRNDDIYLTQEEFKNIQTEVNEIYRKYSQGANQPGKIKYKTFFGMID